MPIRQQEKDAKRVNSVRGDPQEEEMRKHNARNTSTLGPDHFRLKT